MKIERTHRFIGRTHLFLALGVFACAMAFALYTRHAWEDWYITFKASKNLATGNGLGYMPGAPLHSFTSVLGTLIPALLSFVTFNHSDDLVLWLFRILNAGLLALSAVLLAKCGGRWFTWPSATVLLVGGFFLDTKIIDFSINGMETPYLLLALVLFLYFITFHPVAKLKLRLGLVWALLEYSRPDGFVFALLLMAGMLLFTAEKRETLKTLVVSGLVSILIFAPWLLFTLWYYGTPIPHSLAAKAATRAFGPWDLLANTGTYLKSYFLLRLSVLDGVFTPPYFVWFDMPAALKASRYLAFVASLVWLFPGIKPAGRIASFTFFGFLIYLSVFPPVIVPWYLPGATLLALAALASGLDALLARLRAAAPKGAPRLGWSACGILLAYMLALTLISAHQFRWMQVINETGQRERIGAWLKENSKSRDETVFLECVGYIGYYSGLKMYDYPGMTSPETVRARKALGTENWLELVKHLQPDWLILRYDEARRMWERDSAYVMGNYAVLKVFDVNEEIDKIRFKPYEQYFRVDAGFVVARKISPPTAPGGPGRD